MKCFYHLHPMCILGIYLLPPSKNWTQRQYLQVTFIQSVFNTPMMVYQDHFHPYMSHYE